MTTVRELAAVFGISFDHAAAERADQAMDALKSQAWDLVKAYVGIEAVRAFGRFIEDTVKAGAAVDDAATRIGIGADALQELRYAAEQSGVEAEGADRALSRLARMAGDAAAGGTEAAKAFAGVGITVKDANGHVRDADDLLADVADAMKGAATQSDRLRISNDFFGERAGQMAVVLKDGSAGLEAMRAEARALGGTMDDELVQAAAAADDNFVRLRMTLQGFKNLVAGKVIPVVNDLIKRFVAWRVRTREVVDARLERALAAVGWGLRVVAAAAGRWVDALGWVADHMGGATTAAVALGLALGAGLAWKVGATVVALGEFAEKMIAAALAEDSMLLPNLALGAAFLVLAGLLYLLADEIITTFEGGDSLIKRFSGHWGDLVADIQTSGSPDDNWLVKTLRFLLGLGFQVINLVDEAMQGWGFLFTAAGDAVDSVGQQVDRLTARLQHAVEWLMKLGGGTVGTLAHGAASTAFPALTAALDLLTPSVPPTVAPSAAGPGATTHINAPATITVHAAPGADAGAIADQVAKRFGDHLEGVTRNAGHGLVPAGG